MLMKQTILYLPAQIAGPLFQFIAAMVWTFWLTPDAYGVLYYVMAMQELAFVICLAWWSHYTLRFAGTFSNEDERAKFRRVENATLLVSLALQIVVSVLTLALQGIPLTTPMMGATVLYVTTRSVTAHLAERARAAGQITLYTIAQTLGPVLGFGLAFLLVVQVAPQPEVALLGFALAQILGLFVLWKGMGLRLTLDRPDAAILQKALTFGVPLVVAGVIAWVSVNGIRNIVQYEGGHEAVGLVSVGWALGQRLASFVAMLVTAAAFPLAVRYLEEGSREKALHQLSLNGALLFGLLAPATAGLMMILHPTVEVMIAKPFQAVTLSVLPLATLGGALRNLRVHMLDQVFMLFERTDLCVASSALEAVVTVVACILGMWWGGLTGAVAGCVIGFIAAAIFSFSYAVLRFQLKVLWGPVLRICLATMLMMAVLWLVPEQQLVTHPVAQIILSVCLGAAAYGIALAVLFPTALGGLRIKLNSFRSRAA